jgi:hypothetical protein
MLPSVLIQKLVTMRVTPSLCKWILSYLHHRTQRVRIGSVYSDSIVTNIGAPQGCVLSPVLFTHYTDNHRGSAPHTYVIKYADDTAIIGLISENDEHHYRNTISDFITSCDNDGLHLNVKKTKEMIIDFRKKKPSKINPITIRGESIELCDRYKYLGLTISDDLTWKENTEVTRKKDMKKIFKDF